MIFLNVSGFTFFGNGYYMSFDDHETQKLCYPSMDSGSFVEFLIREDLSYNWTSYTALEPVPAHAVKVGTSFENKALFYVRSPCINAQQCFQSDYWWSYYIAGEANAWFYHDWDIKSMSDMEILEIYD